MSSIITAYLFSISSVIAGAGVCSSAFGIRFVFKLAVLWLVFLTIAYFVNMYALIFVVLIFAMSINSHSPEVKVIYYVGLMPILPLHAFLIPFPGINYLWDANFLRVLVLFLFLPVLFQTLSRSINNGGLLHFSDVCFFGFILLVGLMDIRSGSFTSFMRSFLNLIIDFGIPYYVVSRHLSSPTILHWFLCGFVLTAVILSFVSIFEVWSSWRFFTETFFSLGLKFDPVALTPLFRDGFYRSSGGAMLNQLAFAYFMALACVVCFYFFKEKILHSIPAILLMLACVLGLFLTDSKGGILTFLIGVFCIYYFKLRTSFRFMLNVLLVVIVPITLIYLFATEFSAIDDDGSFAYRYQLLLNSFDAISRNPIFGSIDFTENAALQRSIQGEGIIDFVNLYLQVVLQYGFVGLFLYVMIFFSLIWGVIRKPSVMEHDHRSLILALLIGTMFFISTSSDVSFTPFYVVLIWAIARAFIDFPAMHHKLTSD